MSILPRARLLLPRWAGADSDYSRALYVASQITQNSEVAGEAQDMLRAFAVEEEAGDRGKEKPIHMCEPTSKELL
jgi:hypothetical protein